jgi:hypothetical protein
MAPGTINTSQVLQRFCAADLAGGDLSAHNLSLMAGTLRADTPCIYFVQCQYQYSLTANSFLQCCWVEAIFPNLENIKGDRRNSSSDRFGLETVAIAFTPSGEFIWT